MQKTAMTMIICFSLFLLVGTGCASPAPAPKPTSTSTALIVIKKPPSAENKNPAADFCEKNNNNEIIIRFDAKSQKSQSYCRFADTTECAAEEYYQAKCAPGKGSKVYQTPALTENVNFELCSQEYSPVCANNGITYTNECVAKMNKAAIVHFGSCQSKEQTAALSSTDTSQTMSDSSKPDWLPIAISFILEQPVQNPRAFIDKCVYAGNIVYFQSDGCAACSSILYDRNGKTICFPNNNINQSCPAYFNVHDRDDNCKRIWTDTR